MRTLCFCLALSLLCGCSLLKSPPSKFDTKLYNIKTNYINVVGTNMVATGTFDVIVPVIDPVTGLTNFIHRDGTNWTATIVTNRLESYVYESKPSVDAGTAIVTAVGGPWGVLIGGVAAGLYALYGRIRSGKLQEAVEQGAVLAQTLVKNVEQVRSAALAAPNYKAIDDRVMQGVKDVQAAAGVKAQVAELVEKHTDTTIPVSPV